MLKRFLCIASIGFLVSGCATMLLRDQLGYWEVKEIRTSDVIRTNEKIYVEYHVKYSGSRKDKIKLARKWAIIDLMRKSDEKYAHSIVKPGFKQIPVGEKVPYFRSDNYSEHFYSNFVMLDNFIAVYSYNNDRQLVVMAFDDGRSVPFQANYNLAKNKKKPWAPVAATIGYPPAVAYDLVTIPVQAVLAIFILKTSDFSGK